jgi:hypothetical protein
MRRLSHLCPKPVVPQAGRAPGRRRRRAGILQRSAAAIIVIAAVLVAAVAGAFMIVIPGHRPWDSAQVTNGPVPSLTRRSQESRALAPR